MPNLMMRITNDTVGKIPDVVRRLYEIVDQLEEMFPGRPFTPDGHLVGSLGEVWAAYLYGIDLSDPSTKGHDGRSIDGQNVQIKATQGDSVALRSKPEYLLVLKLDRFNPPTEIYNGPGAAAWDAAGRMQSNGQRSISCSKLKRLMGRVVLGDRIMRRSV